MMKNKFIFENTIATRNNCEQKNTIRKLQQLYQNTHKSGPEKM